MGKKIYENKEAWKAQVVKNLQIYNEMPTVGMMPGTKKLTDEEIESKASAIVNDEELLENHKEAVKIVEQEAKAKAIVQEFERKYENLHGKDSFKSFSGYSNFIYCKINTEDSEEARLENEKYLYKMTNPEYAKRELISDMKEALKFDYRKFAFKSDREAIQIYKENYKLLTFMFSVERAVSTTGHHSLSPELQKFYEHFKNYIVGSSAVSTVVKRCAETVGLTLPKDINQMLLLSGPDKPFQKINKNPETLECDGFSEKNGNDPVAKYVSEGAKAEMDIENVENFKMMKSGQIPVDILTDYRCEVDGKTATVAKAAEALINKKGKVEFIPLTEEEKQANMNALENGIDPGVVHEGYNAENDTYLDQYKLDKTHEKFQNLYTRLKNTDHKYNWFNTRKFKNLLSGLKFLSDAKAFEDPAKFKSEINKISKLANTYSRYKADHLKNANGRTRFAICGEILAAVEEVKKETFYADFDNFSRKAPALNVEIDPLDENNELNQAVIYDEPEKAPELENELIS